MILWKSPDGAIDAATRGAILTLPFDLDLGGAALLVDVGAEDLELAIVAALGAAAPLSALVGTHIFPGAIPEDDPAPALTYMLVSYSESFHLLGTSGMATARIRFTGHAADKTTAARIAQAARLALLPIRGAFGSTWLWNVALEGQRHAWEPGDDGTDDGSHARHVDLLFKFRVSLAPPIFPVPGGQVLLGDVGAEDLEQAMVAALGASPDVAALVGAGVFPGSIPEDDRPPALTYTLVSHSERFHLLGTSGMATARIRFTGHAADKTTAVRIAQAARHALLPARGAFGSTRVWHVALAGQRHAWETADDGSDDGTHSRSLDLLFKYQVSIPT